MKSKDDSTSVPAVSDETPSDKDDCTPGWALGTYPKFNTSQSHWITRVKI